MINGVLKQNLTSIHDQWSSKTKSNVNLTSINGILKQNLTSIHDQWSSKTKSNVNP